MKNIFFDEENLDKFLRICEESGFMNDYLMTEEVTKDLLSSKTFLSGDCILHHAIRDYLEYIMRLIDPLPNKYYEKVKQMLDTQNDLKRSLIRRGITEEKEQVCSVLTLSAIYLLINDEWVDLVLRRTNILT